MKTFMKFQSLFMTLIMMLSTMGITTYAAEASKLPEELIATYDFDIAPNENGEGIALLSNVNNTFNVYNGSHTGSTRQYWGNKIRYSVTITDSNGNAVDNILAVQLYGSDNLKKHEGQFWANGSLNIRQDISISSSGNYYFKYVIAYGTIRTLKVHMEITSYN